VNLLHRAFLLREGVQWHGPRGPTASAVVGSNLWEALRDDLVQERAEVSAELKRIQDLSWQVQQLAAVAATRGAYQNEAAAAAAADVQPEPEHSDKGAA